MKIDTATMVKEDVVKAQLKILNGPSKGQLLLLGDDVLRFGRRSDNDVVLDDPAVSRYHAEIRAENGCYVIESVSEKALLKVDSKRLERSELHGVHKLRLGETYLQFKLIEEPMASAKELGALSVADAHAALENRERRSVSAVEPETVEASRSFSWVKTLQFVLLLACLVVAVIVFRSMAPEEMEQIILPYRSGEEKLMDLDGYLKRSGISMMPRRLSVSAPEVMSVKLERPPLSVLWFKTLKQGDCEVILKSETGQPLLKFLFMVRGQVEPDSQRFAWQRLGTEDRLNRARELMDKAKLLGQEEMVDAYLRYEEALDIIGSVSTSLPLYFECRREMEVPKRAFQDRLDFLWKEANFYRKNKDYRSALTFVEEILNLLRSSKNIDYQRAQIHKKYILRRLYP